MADTFRIFTSLRYDPALLEISSNAHDHPGWNREHASPLYMLDLHRDRMLRAATHWGWEAAVKVLSGDDGLRRLSECVLGALGERQGMTSKVRVTVSKEGELGTEVAETPEKGMTNLFPRRFPVPGLDEASDALPSKEPVCEVVLDEQGTGRSEYTHFKTTRRVMYDGARQRAGVGPSGLKEVLIINNADESVMEGSATTPYFWKNGRWVTPPVSPLFNLQNGSGGNDGTTRRWALERGLAQEELVSASSLEDGEECWLSNGVRGFTFGRIKLHREKFSYP